MKKEKLENLLQGLEVESNQPIMQSYLNSYQLVKVWSYVFELVHQNGYGSIAISYSYIKALIRITLSAVCYSEKNLDIRTFLENPLKIHEKSDLSLILSGIDALLLIDDNSKEKTNSIEIYKKIVKIVAIIADRINLGKTNKFYRVGKFGEIVGYEVLEDYFLIKIATVDRYESIYNEALMNSLNNAETSNEFNLDEKMKLADIVFTK